MTAGPVGGTGTGMSVRLPQSGDELSDGPRPMTPATRTWLRCGAAALLVTAVVLLALRIGRSPEPTVDTVVWQFFVDHRQTWLTPVVITWTWVGSTVGMTVVCLVLTVVFLRRGDRRDATLVLGVGIGAALLVSGVKRLVGRDRPPLELRLAAEETLSFPSGHALAATAVLGITAILLPRLVRSTAVAPLRIALVVFWVGICASRLYLAVHWFTDVLAGAALGTAWLLVALSIADRVDRAQVTTAGHRSSGSAPPDGPPRRSGDPDGQLPSPPDGPGTGRL